MKITGSDTTTLEAAVPGSLTEWKLIVLIWEGNGIFRIIVGLLKTKMTGNLKESCSLRTWPLKNTIHVSSAVLLIAIRLSNCLVCD
jgi:hypothetical protein